MCDRCGDARCNDPDSKWCSDILLMRYKAERDALKADAERYRWLREQAGKVSPQASIVFRMRHELDALLAALDKEQK